MHACTDAWTAQILTMTFWLHVLSCTPISKELAQQIVNLACGPKLKTANKVPDCSHCPETPALHVVHTAMPHDFITPYHTFWAHTHHIP